MIDVDAILTEEKKLLDEGIKHEKEGKLVSLEEIKLKQFKTGLTAARQSIF